MMRLFSIIAVRPVVFLLVAACLLASATNSALADISESESIAKSGAPSAQTSACSASSDDLSCFTPDQRYKWLQEQHRLQELYWLIGAMLSALLVIVFFIQRDPAHKPADLLNGSGLVLVVFGTLYVAVCAATSEQLTAPMGILGAIAGYLFGTARSRTSQGAG
jgi:hypothetical protein